MKERKRPRLDAAALWEYALRVLAGRAHSTGDLRQKLRGKAERAADVDPTIARLKEYGYLNDRKFAESFAAARLENEGLGKTRVLADLSRRRVAAARRGVVVKSGGVLERLARCTTLILDKTGTLTAGQPAVTDVVSAGSLPPQEILTLAACLDQVSGHVLAAAIVR